MRETMPDTHPKPTRPRSTTLVEQAHPAVIPARVDSLDNAVVGIEQSTSLLLARVTVLSVPRLSDAELTAARILYEVTREAFVTDRLEDVTALARQWHQLLASRCPNRRLRELFDDETRFRDALTARSAVTRDVAQRIVAEHGRILELVVEQKWPRPLADLLRSHGTCC